MENKKTYKEQLTKLGITVKFLSIKLGISQAMTSYYVNGTRTIPDDIESKINDILKAVKKIA